MFALLKKKNIYEQAAHDVYAALLKRTHIAAFYRNLGVPDRADARFDLLLVHAFLVMDYMLEQGAKVKDFNQALFDVIFADMDQGLRESGIGDMGVPKRMRRLMKAFNGRMHAYQAAIHDDALLQEALVRNLYSAVANPEPVKIEAMKNYIQASRDLIKGQALEEVLAGHMNFAAP